MDELWKSDQIDDSDTVNQLNQCAQNLKIAYSQSSKKKNAADSNLLCACYMEVPDGRQRKHHDVYIHDEDQDVLNDVHHVRVNATSSANSLIPNISYGPTFDYGRHDLRDGYRCGKTSADI